MKTRLNSSFSAISLAVWVLGSSATAFAGDPTAREREEAKRAYTEARTLVKEGKLLEALEKFRRAHELAPTPVTRLELARALAGQGKLLEARELARATSGMPVTATETQKSKDARRDAGAFVIALDARIPTLVVTLPPEASANPGGTEVAVDGKPLSKELLGTELPLDPGDHTLTTRIGDRTAERVERFAESERRTVMAPLPPPVEPPISVIPPSPQQVVSAPPTPKAEVAPSNPQPPVDDDGVHPFVPVMFTIAGVSLLTGTITGSIALSQASDLEKNCPRDLCPPEFHEELALHRGLALTSTIGFIAGGVAATAGAIGWGIDASSGESSTSNLRLRVAGTGIALEGTW